MDSSISSLILRGDRLSGEGKKVNKELQEIVPQRTLLLFYIKT